MSREERERSGRAGASGNRKVRRGPRRFTISMQKRLVVLFLIVLAAFVLLAFRLILIQRDNGRTYTMQVLSQQAYDNKSLPYKRGRITDCKGTVLADSQLVYNVIIDASQMLEDDGKYLEASLNAVARLGIDKEEIRAYVTEHPGSQYYIALKNLPYTDKRAFDRENEEGVKAEQDAQVAAERRGQVGTGDRSEKIRTYNFPQSRLTDHRIGFSLYRLEDVMNGDLDAVFDALTQAEQAEKLAGGAE